MQKNFSQVELQHMNMDCSLGELPVRIDAGKQFQNLTTVWSGQIKGSGGDPTRVT
jgi:hypothetical protein